MRKPARIWRAAFEGWLGMLSAGVGARLAASVTDGLCASAFAPAAAVAGWSAATVVENGVDPILAFGPSGDAAIGASQDDPPQNTGGSTFVARRPAHGLFGTPQRLAPLTYPFDPGEQSELQAIGLPGTGAVVLLFESYADSFSVLPVRVLVEPAGTSVFGAPQQLVGPSGPESNTPSGVIAATTRKEVIAVGSDDVGDVSTDILAAGSTRFMARPSLPALSGPGVGPQVLAVDDPGGAFLTGMGVARRWRKPGWGPVRRAIPGLCRRHQLGGRDRGHR